MASRLKRLVDAKERTVVFAREYAAYLSNRLKVGEGGKVPYERKKGQEAECFGDRVW